jgi:hypothetical protein
VLRWIKIRKRKPLNRCSLMSRRFDSCYFSAATSTGARRCGQELQVACTGIRLRNSQILCWFWVRPLEPNRQKKSRCRHFRVARLNEAALRWTLSRARRKRHRRFETRSLAEWSVSRYGEAIVSLSFSVSSMNFDSKIVPQHSAFQQLPNQSRLKSHSVRPRLNSSYRTLSYASAGHVPGLMFLDSGDVKCKRESIWSAARALFHKFAAAN